MYEQREEAFDAPPRRQKMAGSLSGKTLFIFYVHVVQWFTTLACISKREVIGSNPIMVSTVRGVVLHLLPGV